MANLKFKHNSGACVSDYHSEFRLVTPRRCFAWGWFVLYLSVNLAWGAAIEVEFDRAPGYFEKPFRLSLIGKGIDHAEVRYTLNSAIPEGTNDIAFQTPLEIEHTTLLRAAVFVGGQRVSPVFTRTFLNLEEVIHQPSEPGRLPAGENAWGGHPSSYGMDPQIVDSAAYRDRIRPAMLSLPILSVVCRRSDLFGPRTGIYLHTMRRGDAWERPCSMEWIETNQSLAFQVNAGIQIQGNYNRRPEKTPKHSFRVSFKKAYGAAKLKYSLFPDSTVARFDTLVLRADYNNSWTHWQEIDNVRAHRIRDAWMKDTQRAMGWVSPHNRYCHLFLNGIYWGIYDVAERPDAAFAASYWGGDREVYDAINEWDVKDGNIQRFKEMIAVGERNGAGVERELGARLDLPGYMDYLLLNFYGGNRDWADSKNWYAVGRREPPGKFHFLVWDGEQVFQGLKDDSVQNPNPGGFFLVETIRSNPELALAFADRVQKHCFPEGALTPASVMARWMKRANELDTAIIAESARWGAYRRNPPFTRDGDWMREQRRLMARYFPYRTDVVLGQLRSIGLYPRVDAPKFQREGATQSGEARFSLTTGGVGVTYYTLNAADPRVQGSGEIAKQAMEYREPVAVKLPVTVRARTRWGKDWSALVEVRMEPAVPK